MRIWCVALILLFVTASAVWAEFEEISIQNVGITRVLSGTSNLLKTTKVQASGLQMLDQPSVELMIELDVKGELFTLVPNDFDIKSIDTVANGKEKHLSIELRCKTPELPLTVYMDYWSDPACTYQRKSITILPCKQATGTVLKRVTIEALQFLRPILPLAATASGFTNEAKSSFAAIDPKTGKGLCFSFASGKAEFSRGHSLVVYQQMDVPLEKGFETGRLTLGGVSGKPEAAFAAYRQMLLETRYPALAKNSKYASLRKQFAQCFAVCQYVPPCSEDGRTDAQGHIADNKGFVLLFNPDTEAKTATLPLSDAALNLSGEVNLSDWTALGAPTSLGLKKLDEKITIEVPAQGYRIVGVNVNG